MKSHSPIDSVRVRAMNGILVLFFSHPWSEVWPHHECTFSIYLCPLPFWLTVPWWVLYTSWCCPPGCAWSSSPACTWHCSLHCFFSSDNSLVSSWCDYPRNMLATLLWQSLIHATKRNSRNLTKRPIIGSDVMCWYATCTDLFVVWLMMPGERLMYRVEFGVRVEAAGPLRMVLGSNHASGSRGETRRTGRRDVSRPRQFRRSLSSQFEFSFVRPNAAHADWALPGFVQPVLAVRLWRLPVHRWTHRAVGWRLKDGRVLLLASPCAGIAIISRASDACRVAVRPGPIAAVPLPLRYSPAHPRRPYSAPAFADFNQRLAWGTPILVMTVLMILGSFSRDL